MNRMVMQIAPVVIEEYQDLGDQFPHGFQSITDVIEGDFWLVPLTESRQHGPKVEGPVCQNLLVNFKLEVAVGLDTGRAAARSGRRGMRAATVSAAANGIVSDD